MESEDEKKLAAKVSRDSDYRIAALNNAIKRAGQDGGLDSKFPVLAEAETYYGWLKGEEKTGPPPSEKELKGE